MRIVDAAARVAELEAKLGATEQELVDCKARYEELRHRIKNDLQALSSTFAMQARTSGEADGCAHCASRLRSTAALYYTLDLTGAEVVAMDEYLLVLSDALFRSFGDRISIAPVIEPGIDLDQRRAQRVGMICAEAVMNAVKHAFPNADGMVEVRFRRDGESIEMTVSDNGIGFDPASIQPGHGVSLMQQFARQLDGTLQLERLPAGAAVRLKFAAADSRAKALSE